MMEVSGRTRKFPRFKPPTLNELGAVHGLRAAVQAVVMFVALPPLGGARDLAEEESVKDTHTAVQNPKRTVK